MSPQLRGDMGHVSDSR